MFKSTLVPTPFGIHVKCTYLFNFFLLAPTSDLRLSHGETAAGPSGTLSKTNNTSSSTASRGRHFSSHLAHAFF